MAIRAGSYSTTIWHGVIREDSYPLAVCRHEHETSDRARACSQNALSYFRKNNYYPSGWMNYDPSRRVETQ